MTHCPEPPSDRFCDLVMKGGIASGVVYPKAIAELSHHYRFQSIGGTSAGAIAAAVTAAAEYQRRRTGSRAGFDLLKGLPKELGEQSAVPGKRKLLSLFQPQRPLRRIFSVLIGALNHKKTSSRIWSIIWGFIRAYWPETVSAGLIALLVGLLGLGWFGAGLTLVLTVPGLVGRRVYHDLTKELVAHDLGLCTGLTEPDSADEALTPWLHNLIQKAAGLPIDGDPLTFGQLWDAPGFPPAWLKVPDELSRRSIDLQMFSTNLSHGRPYIFPLPDPAPTQTKYRTRERLYFRESEMKRCLPDNVVKWMVDHSQPYIMEPGREGEDPSTDDPTAEGLRELPEPKHFPVLLAARMSLSFPFLFTAIPLHAINYDVPSHRKFQRCWFSDGGISSNFPMHLFDGLVPMWPTFGLNLEPEIEGRDLVFLPQTYAQGYGERWSDIPEQQGASTLGGFIGAIVGTMQNWNDNSLMRMPGVRDRVARIRLKKDEGGMNLNMEDTLINTVAQRGEQAIDEILRRFLAPASNGRRINGWDEHRFVRLHVLLKMLAARSPGVVDALNPNCQHTTDFPVLFQNMMTNQTDPPPGYEEPMTPAQCQVLKTLITNVQALAAAMTTSTESIPFKPIPGPELRVRPPL
ncbi:MAG: patatin-like phospholipase family protein [Nitrospira sp.]|nr:patatin-like phospholipase family protein [Nitrospira sp.]